MYDNFEKTEIKINMKHNNRIIDDIARLANSTFTGAVNIKNELSEYITQQIEKLMKKMNFVTREEFDIIKKLTQDNRILIEKLYDTKVVTKNKSVMSKKNKD